MIADTEVFRHFFDRATIGIKIINQRGIIIYANDAELDLYGLSKDQFLGRHIFEFLHDKESAASFFDRMKKLEAVEDYNTKLIRRDGSLIDVVIDTSLNCNGGILDSVCCFTRDITSYKRNADLLEYLNRAGTELSLTYDTSTTLQKLSGLIVPEFADWFSIDIIRNDEIEMLELKHEIPEIQELIYVYRLENPVHISDEFGIGKVLRTGKLSFTPVIDELIIDRNFKAADSEQLKKLNPQSAIIVPMIVKDSIAGAISFIITKEGKYYELPDLFFAKDFANRIGLALENTRLYEEAKEEISHRIAAEKKKDEFISMASHELKTPLTSIKAYNQLLAKKLQDNSEVAEFIAKGAGHIKQLERLISDLLDVSKINSGKLSYNTLEFDFGEAVKDCVESVQHTTQHHRIIIERAESILYKGDKQRIEQVIVNFLTNAIKYSPEADKVIIKAWLEGGNIMVSVRDFGIGIAKENLNRLSERFYRVEGSSKKYSGLGLGLFIAEEILEGHGGNFWIESEVDKGSTFYFRLPLNIHEISRIDTSVFYQDKYLTAEFKQNESWIEARWGAYQTFSSLQHGSHIIWNMLKENNCSKIINDNRLFLGNWAEATEEGRIMWFLAMEKSGLRQFAWVLPEEKYNKLSAAELNTDVYGVQIKHFQNVKDAREWFTSS